MVMSDSQTVQLSAGCIWPLEGIYKQFILYMIFSHASGAASVGMAVSVRVQTGISQQLLN